MKLLSSLIIAASLASSAFAGTDYSSKSSKVVQPMAPECDPWAPGFAVGAFADGLLPRFGSSHYAGGGVMGEYFFTDNIGIQGDYSVLAYHSERHQFEANMIARFPIRSINLAPYILAGGTYSTGGASEGGFETGSQSLGGWQAGAGFECRFGQCSHVGFFADGAYHWDASHYARDYVLVRAGFKVTF